MIISLLHCWFKLAFGPTPAPPSTSKLFEYRYDLRAGAVGKWSLVRVSEQYRTGPKGARVSRVRQYVGGAWVLGPASTAPQTDTGVWREEWGWTGAGRERLKAHPILRHVQFHPPISDVSFHNMLAGGCWLKKPTFTRAFIRACREAMLRHGAV